MKKILISFLLVTSMAVASDDLTSVPLVIKPAITTTQTVAQSYNGFLDSIYLDLTGTTTDIVTVASQRTGEIMLTATSTVDKVYRPRVIVQSINGIVDLSATNNAERVKLVEEKLIVTLASSATAVTNTHTVWIKISDK